MNKKPKLIQSSFKLTSKFLPTGDQPEAIDKLIKNFKTGINEQVLLGVTGSGKTFTVAQVIQALKIPTLVISHNKTLAAQLFQEFRDFFPDNAVSYFVSYYDYYQPEAYIPQSNTYIEKETEINEEIDKLRLAATANILTRSDTITIASVSCIYNIGSPREYGHFVLEVKPGIKITREMVAKRLVQLQYSRNNYTLERGTFRIRGNIIDIYPAYEDKYIRFVINDNQLQSIESLDPTSGNIISKLDFALIYPAKHYMTDPSKYKQVFDYIRNDLDRQIEKFQKQNKLIEAQRIKERVAYDLEMIEEMGYVNGIENYSRYFDGRSEGAPPYSLFDYYQESYGKDWLIIIDESHMTIPQIRGMYNGDRSRKQTLVDFGFRLPAALDNRPLRFDEFLRRIPKIIYVSATPADWELNRVHTLTKSNTSKSDPVTEQLVRPTGLVDPKVIIRPIANQIEDITKEILNHANKHERVLVTTLTKRMAEDLSAYLKEKDIKVNYLHADIQTLKRSDILTDLRSGKFDVIIGVNLLREGLDLPEVSLVAVLDADKEGFLRSRTSLIQTMGRAARHKEGLVILYADKITDSIKAAVNEVKRRRIKQLTYNKIHNIIPSSIIKPIRDSLVEKIPEKLNNDLNLNEIELDSMTPKDKNDLIKRLEKSMRSASKDLNFEEAVRIRDFINSLK